MMKKNVCMGTLVNKEAPFDLFKLWSKIVVSAISVS